MSSRLICAFLVFQLAHPAEAALRKWNQKMQELAKTFSEILPETVSATPNKKKLEAGTKKLMTLAHTINMGPDTKGNPLPPEADPTLGFVSGMFERDLKRAYQTLKSGHVDYAKALLRSTSTYCIACHTRHDKGPDFPTLTLPEKAGSLSAVERGELFAATRQFDRAFQEFETVAGDAKLAVSKPIEWGKAVRNALTIAVRVKKDPERALEVLNKVSTLPRNPAYLRENLSAWKESVEEWKKEKAKTFNTEEGLFMEAVRLNEAAKKKQAFPLDHSADVLYLRVSTLAHELLTTYPQGKRNAEALYLAGNAYDLLQDRIVSPLPDMYYEACVRQSPHTEISQRCYHRLEQNVYFGWTGSGGTSIPDDISELLRELQALAKLPSQPEP